MIDLEDPDPVTQARTAQRESIEARAHQDVLRHPVPDGGLQQVFVVARAAQHKRRTGVGAHGVGERRGPIALHDEVGARPQNVEEPVLDGGRLLRWNEHGAKRSSKTLGVSYASW